jgi:hypothetical protein
MRGGRPGYFSPLRRGFNRALQKTFMHMMTANDA